MPPTTNTQFLPSATGVVIREDDRDLLVSRSQNLKPSFTLSVDGMATTDATGVNVRWNPAWARLLEGSRYALEAQAGVAIENPYRKTDTTGSIFLGAAFHQSYVQTRTAVGRFSAIPSVSLWDGVGSPFTRLTPFNRFEADLGLAAYSPPSGAWELTVGASAGAQNANPAIGGFLSFSLPWEKSNAVTPVQIENVDPADDFNSYFEELDLTSLATADLSGMKNFWNAGREIPANAHPFLQDFTEHHNSNKRDAITYVFHVPEGPDLNKRLELIKRSLLFLFLSGNEKTNPYYGRFDQFRFLIIKKPAAFAKQDIAEKCGDTPGVDLVGDNASEYLYRQGFEQVTIINSLPGCRSQAAPFDYSTPPRVASLIRKLVSDAKQSSRDQIPQLILSSLNTLKDIADDRETFERTASVLEEAFEKKSLDPIYEKLMAFYWAPRVYLGETDPSQYMVLRHELVHPLPMVRNGKLAHGFVPDAYAEGTSSSLAQTLVKQTAPELIKPILPHATRLLGGMNPLFPVLFPGETAHKMPTEPELKMVLDNSSDREKILALKNADQLRWKEEGFYMQGAGLWQYELKVNNQGEPDSNGNWRPTLMAASSDPYAVYGPLLYQEIQGYLDTQKH